MHFFSKKKMKPEQYQTYHLQSGLRLIYKHVPNAVAYCGAVVGIGSRDENDKQWGMAHLIEHMLFKGTKKRRASQIINRLEDVGGDFNAFTTKEETVVYAGVLNEFSERAIELIADVVQYSIFPQKEIEKEIEVIKDEIQSYNDSPGELIFDEFEDMLYGNHSMAHNVLGTEQHLSGFTKEDIYNYYRHSYRPDNMVFFYLGGIESKKVARWIEKHFKENNGKQHHHPSTAPAMLPNRTKTVKRNTFQVHCLMGNYAFDIYHPYRKKLYLLNNILGGPGMNSLLNIALREKHGLVYQVESTYQSFTDSGYWGVYFGTDAENIAKCEKLIKKELRNLCDSKITEAKLKKYKKQLVGQLTIAAENHESLALSLGKSYMRFGKFDSLQKIQNEIEETTAEELRNVAEKVFDIDNLTILKYV